MHIKQYKTVLSSKIFHVVDLDGKSRKKFVSAITCRKSNLLPVISQHCFWWRMAVRAVNIEKPHIYIKAVPPPTQNRLFYSDIKWGKLCAQYFYRCSLCSDFLLHFVYRKSWKIFIKSGRVWFVVNLNVLWFFLNNLLDSKRFKIDDDDAF